MRNFAGELITATASTDGIYIFDPLGDNDGDDASNLAEQNAGTDPFNPDSDGDKMPDGWEIANSLNPLGDDAFDDTDDDAYSNLQEIC
ncbi:MAG: hypothetical protein U5R30_15290 [Deltaproteobacteria bacterium]|nr:hypothetical protein [Deltaproteobacteria bacterium]